MGEAFIDSMRLAPIRDTFPICQVGRIFLYDCDASIFAIAIYDDQFQVWVTLVKGRLYRLFDVWSLVIGGDNDGDTGKYAQVSYKPRLSIRKKFSRTKTFAAAIGNFWGGEEG